MIHYTAMDSAQAALRRLCDPVAEVSAHYLISKDGTCWQMVVEHQRAWHAGAGEWCGLNDINSRSIGIELDNRGDHPFGEPQMAMLEQVLAEIMARWGISERGIIGHSDMAPGRKIDPGPRFDWARFAPGACSGEIWGGRVPQDLTLALFCRLAREAGYTSPVDDQTLLSAVRLRHRPWAKGPLCPADFTAFGCRPH